MEPSSCVTVSVAQKAKDVRVDPVLLLIPRTRFLVRVAPVVQELQASPPTRLALTRLKSLDVQEEGKVCETASRGRLINARTIESVNQ